MRASDPPEEIRLKDHGRTLEILTVTRGVTT